MRSVAASYQPLHPNSAPHFVLPAIPELAQVFPYIHGLFNSPQLDSNGLVLTFPPIDGSVHDNCASPNLAVASVIFYRRHLQSLAEHLSIRSLCSLNSRRPDAFPLLATR